MFRAKFGKYKNKNINLFDLTCPKVLHIRTIIKDYLNDDTYIILIAQFRLKL